MCSRWTAWLLTGIGGVLSLGCDPSALHGSLDVRPVSVVPAQAAPAAVPAYEAMKRLAGEWTVVEEGKRTPATFEVVAGGAALVQKSGFVAMFYPAGEHVAVSFFPDDGYQERLRSEPKAGEGGGLDLEFTRIDVTNLKQGSTSSPGFTVHVDADGARMVQTWRFADAAGKESKMALVFERSR